MGREVVFDAEHFFDGFRADPRLRARRRCRRRPTPAPDWLVLCETNGGTLPVAGRGDHARGRPARCRRRSACTATTTPAAAVANSLAAVRSGCTQVQGTINGYGERVRQRRPRHRARRTSSSRWGTRSSRPSGWRELTALSRFVAEVANLKHDDHQPYVGHSAFAHKGGIHVAAMLKAERHLPAHRAGPGGQLPCAR
ncbi:MAG: hypothetical protein M0C28_32590 [Candidatus Moduliflexus flocculans]|nr:hypothetical protein [Candidatus Moduliflexus flocculans]